MQSIKPLVLTLALINLTTVQKLASAQSILVNSKIPSSGDLRANREGNIIRLINNSRLQSGDQIYAGKGVNATIACSNENNKRQVPQTTWTTLKKLCPKIVINIARGNSVLDTYSLNDSALPYIITPRQSFILDGKPMIRWNPVSGSSQYQIQIRKGDKVVWEGRTTATSIQYPGTPAIQPSVAYSIIVKTSNGKSSEADTETMPEFRLLRSNDLAPINSAVKTIQSGDLSAISKALQISELYSNYALPDNQLTAYGLSPKESKQFRLIGPAIEVLEAAVKANPNNIILYQELGLLYNQAGLDLLAAESYAKAIDLAQSPDELETWTNLQVQIATISINLKQEKKAIEHYKLARWGFNLLEQKDNANLITKQIQKLSPK
jgi:hypothetical protein